MEEVIKNLKSKVVELYNKFPKEEDGFVAFREGNELYLMREMYVRHEVRTIIGMCVEDDGEILLYDDAADDYFSFGVYDESEYEILSKLMIVLENN